MTHIPYSEAFGEACRCDRDLIKALSKVNSVGEIAGLNSSCDASSSPPVELSCCDFGNRTPNELLQCLENPPTDEAGEPLVPEGAIQFDGRTFAYKSIERGQYNPEPQTFYKEVDGDQFIYKGKQYNAWRVGGWRNVDCESLPICG